MSDPKKTITCVRSASVAPIVRAEGETDTEKQTGVLSLRWTSSAQVVRQDWFGDEFVEILDPAGADLSRLNDGAPLLDSHRAFSSAGVIGSVVRGSARMDGAEGFADVRLSDAPSAADTRQKIEEGSINSVSVGYSIDSYEWVTPKEGRAELRVSRWTPLEVSAVPVPADARAQFLRALLPAGGLPMSERSIPATPETPADTVDVAEIQRAERERVRYCAEFARAQKIDDAQASAIIDKGLSQAETVAALWDVAAKRAATVGPQQVGSGVSVGDGPAGHLAEQIRAAIIVRLGESNDKIRAIVTDADRRAAHGMERAGFGDFARELIVARGGTVPRFAGAAEIMERAHAGAPPQYRSPSSGARSMTTSDLPSITVDAVNVIILRMMEAAGIDYWQFCERYNPPTGGTIHFPQLASGFTLTEVTEGQEAPLVTISDSKETSRMRTFSASFGISHELMRLDRFGEIAAHIANFGMAIPRTRLDVVFAAIASNPTMSDGTTFYHADHANLSGSGAAPTVALVTSAVEAIQAQTGLDGKPIGKQPVVALASFANATIIDQLFGITVTQAIPTALTSVAPARTRQSITAVLDDPRHAGTAWYLFGTVTKPFYAGTADGSALPSVVSRYDELTRTNRVTVADEFYCAPINWRAAYKNAGT